MADAYPRLRNRLREVATASSVLSLLHWDQETMMPPRSAPHRARQIAWLSRWVHERVTEPAIGEWIEASASDPAVAGDPVEAANVREIKRHYERARRIPPDLVARLSETGSHALQAWKAARGNSEWSAFAPWLEKLVVLLREKAQAYGVPDGGEPWDALAEDYEPGARGAHLESLFRDLRGALVPVIRDASARTRRLDLAAQRDRRVPVADQQRLNAFVARRLGYDFDRGRLDASTHPFTQGLGPGDTRITTRYREVDFTEGLGSTIHEVGHALYEQGLPKEERFGEPLAEEASLGIHESQSRLWENQVGRSPEFWDWLMPHALDLCDGALDGTDAADWCTWVNRVEPHPIRVESDETTYNLHIMLRFDLERALLHGDLAVGDVPGLWNERMKRDLDIEPRNDAEGCLQDIHWSMGAIGYFPTYTLGNLYSAQLWTAAEQAIGGLSSSIAEGDFAPLLDWLREHVHAHGRRFPAGELCRRVTGEPLRTEPLVEYLAGKAARL